MYCYVACCTVCKRIIIIIILNTPKCKYPDSDGVTDEANTTCKNGVSQGVGYICQNLGYI